MQAVEQIKHELAAPDFDAIIVGRLPATAASADYRVAVAQARALADRPRYFAKCGDRERIVSENEYLMLKNQGAREGSLR